MKDWQDPQVETFVQMVSSHWHFELLSGSVFYRYNLLNPEWYPLLIHRFPIQRRQAIFYGNIFQNEGKCQDHLNCFNFVSAGRLVYSLVIWKNVSQLNNLCQL